MLISPESPREAWLLLRTKHKQEKLAEESLQGRTVETYCPRVLEGRRHRHAPLGPVPLFPSYLFARCEIPSAFSRVAYCPGIVDVVRFGQLVAAVEADEIEALRAREQGRGFVTFRSVRQRPTKGSRVSVTSGPFKGLEGIVDEYVPAHDRVRLLLKAVSGTWRVLLDREQIRVA